MHIKIGLSYGIFESHNFHNVLIIIECCTRPLASRYFVSFESEVSKVILKSIFSRFGFSFKTD